MTMTRKPLNEILKKHTFRTISRVMKMLPLRYRIIHSATQDTEVKFHVSRQVPDLTGGYTVYRVTIRWHESQQQNQSQITWDIDIEEEMKLEMSNPPYATIFSKALDEFHVKENEGITPQYVTTPQRELNRLIKGLFSEL